MKNHELMLKTATATQTPLTGFNAAVSLAMSRTLSGYLLFVPAIIWTWFAVETVVPALGYQSSIALFLLFPTGLVAYAAGAAKASGRCKEGIMRLYLTRFSAVLDYCWLYSYYLICGLVLTITLSFFGNINHGGFITEMLPLYGALFILICTRLWPMIVVPFLSSAKTVSLSAIWKISALGQAWSLTRRNGTFLHTTVPLLISGGILFGGYLILRPAIESSAFGLLTLNICLYAIALPLFITLVDVLAEQLASASKSFVESRKS